MPSKATRLLRLALLALLVLSLASCTRKPDSREVVRFWAMGFEGEIVAQLIPEFERTHPGIRIQLQQLPWTAAHEKLLTAFAGDSTPDICQLGNTWIPEFAALNALEPLDSRIKGSTAIDVADYFPGIWDTNVIDGKVYGVPWYVDTRLPYYRRDLLKAAGFDKPPVDWAEWRQAMAAIKAQAGPEKYSILLPLNEFEPLLALALQQEEPLLREGGRFGNFRSEGFRRTLTFYKEMFDQQWAPPVTNIQISNVWDEFDKGFYSFYISGPWNIAEFKKRIPAARQDEWMTMPLPGPDGPGASIAGGSSLVLFRASNQKPAAWAFLEYLSSATTQERFQALTGDLPPRRSVWKVPRLAADPYALAFRDQLERAKPTPKVPEWERIATEMRLVTEQMVNGKLDVDGAATELDRRADKILEKRRWMLDRAVAK